MKRTNALLSLIAILLLLSSPSAAAPVDWSQPVFGVVEGFFRSGEAQGIGISWERVPFYWYEFQPSSSADFNASNISDGFAGTALNGGRQVVGIVKGTPPWASASGSLGAVPSGLDLPYHDPANYWGAFVTQLVSYYSGRGIHHWIVWNEPNIRSGEGVVEFEGDVSDYARMLKVFYQAAKAVDPAAHIQMAGLSWHHDTQAGRAPYLQRLLQAIAADPDAAANNWYFDGISLHIYFTTSSIWEIVNANIDILNRFGLGHKQVWLSEFNASPRRDPIGGINAVFNVSLEQQADFIVQASGLALAAGVDRLAVYRMFDNDFQPGVSEPWGLIRFDGTPRPAYYAYQQVIQRFSGAQDVSRYSNGQATVIIASFPDQTRYFMWSDRFAAGQFLINTDGAEVPVFDSTGNQIAATIQENGMGVIDAPAAEQIDRPNVVVAGAVRMISLAESPRPVQFRSIGGSASQLN